MSTIITQQYQHTRVTRERERWSERGPAQGYTPFSGLFVSLCHMEMGECCSYIRISISLCLHCLDELMNILAQNKYAQSHCGCISPPHRCISLFQRVPNVICGIHRVSYQTQRKRFKVSFLTLSNVRSDDFNSLSLSLFLSLAGSPSYIYKYIYYLPN